MNRLSGSGLMFGISWIVTVFCIFVCWINHLNKIELIVDCLNYGYELPRIANIRSKQPTPICRSKSRHAMLQACIKGETGSVL